MYFTLHTVFVCILPIFTYLIGMASTDNTTKMLSEQVFSPESQQKQNGGGLELCNVTINKDVIPGYIITTKGVKNCSVAYHGVQNTTSPYKVLEIPPNYKWMKHKPEMQSAACLMKSGQYEGTDVFVCQTTVMKILIAGMYNFQLKTCHLGHDGHEFQRSTDVQVLADGCNDDNPGDGDGDGDEDGQSFGSYTAEPFALGYILAIHLVTFYSYFYLMF